MIFESHFIKGSSSIADLFKEKNRCGIYVLTFANGERYIGKTIDIVKRYSQHRRIYKDIEEISFSKVLVKDLSSIEKERIRLMESSGYKLRNISLMEMPYEGELPEKYRTIDLIVSPQEQEIWLTGSILRETNDERRDNSIQNSKYKNRFLRLQEKKYFIELIDIFHSYFDIGIPYPERTEYAAYSTTCLPESHIYSRININVQEVFTAFEESDQFYVSLHIAKSPLLNELSSLKEKHVHLTFKDHAYKPGGKDQINLIVRGQDAKEILKEPAVSKAIRLMNLRLMRRGANTFSKSHCPQLVTAILK